MYLLVVCHVLCVAELNIWLEGIPSISWFSDAIANNILNLNKKYFLAHALIMIMIFFFVLVMKASTPLEAISTIFTSAGM